MAFTWLLAVASNNINVRVVNFNFLTSIIPYIYTEPADTGVRESTQLVL